MQEEVQKKFLTSGIRPYSGHRISLSFPWQRTIYFSLLCLLSPQRWGTRAAVRKKREVNLAITRSVALGSWLYY